MGRRSTHTHEELRELVLRSAQEIIEAEGLSGLSAREIARKIGYSPGTLYNVFNNLDELVLHVEARLLDGLKEHLAAVDREGTPNEVIRRLAQAYLKFTHDRPKLWNLLLEHNVSAETAIPPWYHDRIEGLLTHVEKALAPLLVTNDPVSLKRSARVL